MNNQETVLNLSKGQARSFIEHFIGNPDPKIMKIVEVMREAYNPLIDCAVNGTPMKIKGLSHAQCKYVMSFFN